MCAAKRLRAAYHASRSNHPAQTSLHPALAGCRNPISRRFGLIHSLLSCHVGDGLYFARGAYRARLIDTSRRNREIRIEI